MKKLLEIPHHLDDYECMWNGIEDLYIQGSGETLPPSFFFVLSGFGSFCYMKTEKLELKRLVALGDGRTKKMYEFLAPIVGFDYKFYKHSSFEKALSRAKSEIDAGFPCVLGALDMAYLPYYPKLYHGEHIPFHYVLMTGYDDEAQLIYLSDCGRAETQTLPYDELRLAWNCSYPGLSDPNTVCTVRMHSGKTKAEIAAEAFSEKAKLFLNPPVGFIGYRGFEKFIGELPRLKKELSDADYKKLLANFAEFSGTVPTVPNALRGIDEPDEVTFCGGFDKASLVLKMLGEEYKNEHWLNAAAILSTGAPVISQIKDIIVDYIAFSKDETELLPEKFTEVKNILIEGLSLLEY